MKRTDEERRLRKYLTELTSTVRGVLTRVDDLTHEPAGRERDAALAKHMNELELANDAARHFGLGEKL